MPQMINVLALNEIAPGCFEILQRRQSWVVGFDCFLTSSSICNPLVYATSRSHVKIVRFLRERCCCIEMLHRPPLTQPTTRCVTTQTKKSQHEGVLPLIPANFMAHRWWSDWQENLSGVLGGGVKTKLTGGSHWWRNYRETVWKSCLAKHHKHWQTNLALAVAWNLQSHGIAGWSPLFDFSCS